MSKKKQLTTITLAGTAFVATMAASNVASAAEGTNPFAMNELSSGYMQVADNHMEGKCGGKKEKAEKEGKCGGAKKEKKEGKCGEGKCGEGKCGSKKEKKSEKEGKCGGKK